MSSSLCYVIEAIEQICIIDVCCRENDVDDSITVETKGGDIEYYSLYEYVSLVN